MSIKHLFKAVALITIFSIITRILGFGFRIFLSRSMGAELLGFYTIALSFFHVLESFVSSGIPICVSKQVSEAVAGKKGKKQIGGILSSAINITILLAIMSLAIVLLLKPVISNSGDIVFKMVLILVPAVLFCGIYSAVRGTMWGFKNFFGVCITELIEQIIRIALCVVMFLCLPNVNKMISATISLAISIVIAAAITFIYYFKSGQVLSSPKGFYKTMLKSSLPITAVRFTGSFLQPVISFIVPLRLISAGFTRSQAVASLGVSLGMVFPLLYLPGTIVGSLAMALVPDLSGCMARGEKDVILNRVRSSIVFTLIVAMAFVPLFIAVGEQVGIVLFNNVESGILLRMGAIAMVPMSLSNITSTILNSLGLEVKSMRNYLIGSVALFASIWFLPSIVGGGLALIIGMGLCTLIASILNIVMIEKKLGKKVRYIKDFIILTIFAYLCGFIGRESYGLISRILPMFISAVLAGLVALLLFGALLSIFKFVNIKGLLRKFKLGTIKSLKYKRHSN